MPSSLVIHPVNRTFFTEIRRNLSLCVRDEQFRCPQIRIDYAADSFDQFVDTAVLFRRDTERFLRNNRKLLLFALHQIQFESKATMCGISPAPISLQDSLCNAHIELAVLGRGVYDLHQQISIQNFLQSAFKGLYQNEAAG